MQFLFLPFRISFAFAAQFYSRRFVAILLCSFLCRPSPEATERALSPLFLRRFFPVLSRILSHADHARTKEILKIPFRAVQCSPSPAPRRGANAVRRRKRGKKSPEKDSFIPFSGENILMRFS